MSFKLHKMNASTTQQQQHFEKELQIKYNKLELN